MKNLLLKVIGLLSGNIVSSIVRALTLVLLARIVLPADFALYAGIYGVLILLKACSDLGIHKYILRERARDSSSALVTQALRINNRASLALFSISAVGLLLFSNLSDLHDFSIMLLGLVAAFEKNADTWFCVLVADGHVRMVSFDRALRRCVALGIMVAITLVVPEFPLLGIIAGDLVAAVSSYLLSRYFVARLLPPAESDAGSTWTVLKESLPFWVNGLSMHTKSLDVAIVGFAASPVMSGYFAVASRISDPLLMIPQTMSSILISHASGASATSRRPLVLTVVTVSSLFAGFSVIVVPFIPWVVTTFIGDQYGGAILPMQIIICALPIQVVSGLTSAILQGAGASVSVSRASVAYVVVYLSILAAGAYYFGANGAAFATVASQIVFLICMIRPANRWLRHFD